MLKENNFWNFGQFLSLIVDKTTSPTFVVIVYFELFRILDENEEMTDLGKLLVELPIDPQFGKMILIGMTLKCLDPAIIIACCSAYKEPCTY